MPEPARHALDVGRLAKGTVVVFALTFFGLGLNYLYSVLLARVLGAEVFGLYSIGLSAFSLLAVLSVIGQESAVLRFLPGALHSGHKSLAGSVLRSTISISAIGGVVVAALLAAFSDTLASTLFHREELRAVFNAFALAIPAYATGSVLLSSLQAHHDVRYRMLIKYVSEPVFRFGLTLVFFILGWRLEGALVGFVCALWLTVVLGFFALRRVRARRRSLGEGREPGRANTWRAVLGYSAYLFAGTILMAAATRSDVLLLGYFADAHRVGIYAAAFQTAAIMAIVLQCVESIIAPVMSESISHGDHAQQRRIYALSLRWTTLLALPLFSTFLIFPEEILSLFGEAFLEATPCFVLLSLAQIVNLGTGSANYMLLLSGRARLVLMNDACNSILLVLLNALLVPQYGILGAAIAVSAVLVAINVARVIEVRILLGMQPYEWALAKPLLACIAASVPIALARVYVPPSFHLWLALPLAAAYFGAIYALGLTDEDRQALRGLVAQARGGATG